MNREEVKQNIKKYIDEHGEPVCAYFYNDCRLVLEYTDSETGLSILSNETFKYWEDNVLIGKNLLKENYEKIFEELGIDCIVMSIENRDLEESLEFIEDELYEYCSGNSKLLDKLNRMSKIEKVNWYSKIVQEENDDIEDDIINDKNKLIRELINNPNTLESKYAKFNNDKKIMLKVLKKVGYALEYASDELKNDKEIVLVAVKQNAYALQYASKELRNDKEVVSLAISNDPAALKYASNNIKNDRKFVLNLMKQNVYALSYASNELQNDKELLGRVQTRTYEDNKGNKK